MQQNELSKISPVSLFVLAIVVFVSSTVSIFVNRLFNNADILADDHSTLANIVKTVDSIIKTVDGKVDKDIYNVEQKAILEKLDAVAKNQEIIVQLLTNRKQVYLEK